VILGACLAQTRGQLQFWKNSDDLFQHAISVTGINPRAEYLLGLSLEREGRMAEAMAHYRNAINSPPKVKEAFANLGRLLGQQGKWSEAEALYTARLEEYPNDFDAHLGLAITLPHLRRNPEAETQLQAAIKTCPNAPEALNNLAWLLATSEEAKLRDGPRAVELAQRACDLTSYRETIMVGTLGAAYAEAGRFDEAILTAQKACALAGQSGAGDLLKVNQQLLELYRQHQPDHESN